MDSEKKTIKLCVVCGKKLIGLQRKYCCSSCINKDFRKNNPDYSTKYNMVERKKIWRINNREKYLKQLKKQYKTRKERYPEKEKARNYAYRNNQKGKYCIYCFSYKNLEFHHTDYYKNKGVTLCKRCHKELHKKINEK